MIIINLTLNGAPFKAEIEENALLVDVLRDRDLKGTRVSCDQGACGACTVLVDGRPITACLTFAFAVDGADIVTVEGVAANDGTFSPVQAAFEEAGVPQCGFCTSGMVLLAESYFAQHPAGRPPVRNWMNANICRCSGYLGIARALDALGQNGA